MNVACKIVASKDRDHELMRNRGDATSTRGTLFTLYGLSLPLKISTRHLSIPCMHLENPNDPENLLAFTALSLTSDKIPIGYLRLSLQTRFFFTVSALSLFQEFGATCFYHLEPTQISLRTSKRTTVFLPPHHLPFF